MTMVLLGMSGSKGKIGRILNPAKNTSCEVTREYVKYSWKRPFSDPGLGNGLLTGDFFQLANSDMYPETKTIYQAYNEKIGRQASMSILEMITRGVNNPKLIDIDDIPELLNGWLKTLLNRLGSIFTGKKHLRNENKVLDNSAFDNLLTSLGENGEEKPGIFVVWLPGMDGFSHKNGATKQPEYFKDDTLGKMDEQFGRLKSKLAETNLLDNTLVVITADHGQYDCSQRIPSEKLYEHLKSKLPNEKYPLKANGEIDDDCDNASVVIVENGGACYIYIRMDNDWNKPPDLNRMQNFLTALSGYNGTDRIFVRDKGIYKLWQNGNCMTISNSDPNYPFAKDRIDNLAKTTRSPDIILSAKATYYYAKKDMKGEHGSLQKENSHVPLIFINSKLQKENVTNNAQVIDIAPTIADSMGFLTQLMGIGTPEENLNYILDALEKLINSKLYRRGFSILGKMKKILELDKIEREWYYDELNMRDSFERELKDYLGKHPDKWSDYDGLVRRYKEIVSESKSHFEIGL